MIDNDILNSWHYYVRSHISLVVFAVFDIKDMDFTRNMFLSFFEIQFGKPNDFIIQNT